MALVSLIEDEMVGGVLDIWVDTFRIPVLHPLHLGLYSSGHHNVSKLTTQADLNEVLTLIITSEDWRDIVIFYDDTFGKKWDKKINHLPPVTILFGFYFFCYHLFKHAKDRT